MIKYGLKLWSTNKNHFNEAVKLYKNGLIDFIELYVVPNALCKEDLIIFKNIPVQLHTMHSLHDFDIFDLSKKKINLFKNQILKLADFLNTKHIILHAGIGDNYKIFKKNIAKIYDKRIIIENLPKIGLDKKNCFGYSLAQLNFIKKTCKLNICFDFAHAIKSAKSQNLNHKSYLKSLIRQLNPCYFHIDGCNTHKEKDEHLDLPKGNFDIKWAKKLLTELSLKKDVLLVFETPKHGNNLKNDIKNINYFKNLKTNG